MAGTPPRHHPGRVESVLPDSGHGCEGITTAGSAPDLPRRTSRAALPRSAGAAPRGYSFSSTLTSTCASRILAIIEAGYTLAYHGFGMSLPLCWVAKARQAGCVCMPETMPMTADIGSLRKR